MATRGYLLAALRLGPVPISDWRKYAASPNSLKTRIHLLREDGYEIVAREDSRDGPRRTSSYVLVEEPDRMCKYCGRH